MSDALRESHIPGLPVRRGKIRDIYELGEGRLLVVTTDRVSVGNVVFPNAMPGKGRILNKLSTWWFERTAALVPNHFITARFEEFPESLQPHRAQLEGRSMIVRATEPIPGQFIMRGYLDGSAWRSYEFNQTVLGHELLSGLRPRSAFGVPLFTPTTKENRGKDRNLDVEDFAGMVGREYCAAGRRASMALFTYAHNYMHMRGLILADTKFEFGVAPDGEFLLIDELLTPDSSRIYRRETYSPDIDEPDELDKQLIFEWLDEQGSAGATAPVPDGLLAEVARRYELARAMIMD